MKRPAPLLLLVLLAAARPIPLKALLMPAPETLVAMGSWQDSVTVSARRYAVPGHWRGLRRVLDERWLPADLEPVPAEYCAPGSAPRLRSAALAAFARMARAASSEGVILLIRSGYRSAADQAESIARRLAAGRDFAEITWGIAPPGYSEHMLGTAVDLLLDAQYEKDPAYRWLRKHAGAFGFVESYPPDGVEDFPWEPWHWAYRPRENAGRGPVRAVRAPGGGDLGG